MCRIDETQSVYLSFLAIALAETASGAAEPRLSRTDICHSLDRELAQICSEEAALDARRARCLREIDRLEIWRDLGYPSILAYLEARLGASPRTCADRLRVARALGELPHIEAALDRGEVSQSAARELCRVAAPNTELAWLERAKGKPLRVIEEMVRGHRKGSHPDDDQDPDLRWREVTIRMSPATHALYRQTKATLSDEAGRHLEEDELIATMCHRSLEPASGDAPTVARHQVAVTVCTSCDRGWQDGAGATIEIEPAAIEVALCDAQHIGDLDADTPERAHQDVTPAVRRLVWRRDHGRCRVEGCRSARNLDVHHVVHRADGGGHEPSNLVVMCAGCHTALHRGLITVARAASGYVFARTHVLAVPSVGCDTPASTRDTLRTEACEVLVTSGFRKHVALAAVDAAIAWMGDGVSLEELLPEAFRQCRQARACEPRMDPGA